MCPQRGLRGPHSPLCGGPLRDPALRGHGVTPSDTLSTPFLTPFCGYKAQRVGVREEAGFQPADDRSSTPSRGLRTPHDVQGGLTHHFEEVLSGTGGSRFRAPLSGCPEPLLTVQGASLTTSEAVPNGTAGFRGQGPRKQGPGAPGAPGQPAGLFQGPLGPGTGFLGCRQPRNGLSQAWAAPAAQAAGALVLSYHYPEAL